jgi:hypothetical protein
MRTLSKSGRHIGKTYTESVAAFSSSWLNSSTSSTRLDSRSPKKTLFCTRCRPKSRQRFAMRLRVLSSATS